MLSVLVSAVVEESVQVEIPEALVAEHAFTVLFEPLAVKTGVVPLIGFEFASSKVTVIEEVEAPSGSIGPVPVIVLVVVLAAPGLNTTTFPVTLGETSESVFDSA